MAAIWPNRAGNFPLLVGNGVTSVRDMGSDFAQIPQWKAARTAGAVIPRIVAAGPKLRGGSIIGARWRAFHQVESVRYESSPRRRTRAMRSMNSNAREVDFIKVHEHLTPVLYEAISTGVPQSPFDVCGSACRRPRPVGAKAAAAGQLTIEHGRGMLLCSAQVWARIRVDAPADAILCAQGDTGRAFPGPHPSAHLVYPDAHFLAGQRHGRRSCTQFVARRIVRSASEVWPALAALIGKIWRARTPPALGHVSS